MIYLYSGTPGSGKSLHAAQMILQGVKKEKLVVANFEINLDALPDSRRYLFEYIPNEQLSPLALESISKAFFSGKRAREGGILLVIDEAQLILNAMQWQKVFFEGWLSFFTQHRKLGYDIILIAQYDRMLSRQIRSLIEYEYAHRKISNIGGFWGAIMPLFVGNFYVSEGWYPVKMRVGGRKVKYNKKIFQLYDSYKTWG